MWNWDILRVMIQRTWSMRYNNVVFSQESCLMVVAVIAAATDWEAPAILELADDYHALDTYIFYCL